MSDNEASRCNDGVSKFDKDIEYIQNSIRIFSQNVQESMNAFQETLRKYFESPAYKQIEETLSKIGELSLSLVSEFTGEKFEAKRQSIVEWASLGWVISDEIPMYIFYKRNITQEEADNEVLAQIDPTISDTFHSIERSKKVPSYIYEEMKTCYDLKYYESASMLACGRIENLLLRFQSITVKRINRLAVGNGAVQYFKAQTNEIANDIFIRSLFLISIYTFLDKFYESFKNVKPDDDFPNRNLLFHGLNSKPISQIQCIKIIFALHLLSIVIDIGEQYEEITSAEDIEN